MNRFDLIKGLEAEIAEKQEAIEAHRSAQREEMRAREEEFAAPFLQTYSWYVARAGLSESVPILLRANLPEIRESNNDLRRCLEEVAPGGMVACGVELSLHVNPVYSSHLRLTFFHRACMAEFLGRCPLRLDVAAGVSELSHTIDEANAQIDFLRQVSRSEPL
jgi:hypothetical protein